MYKINIILTIFFASCFSPRQEKTDGTFATGDMYKRFQYSGSFWRKDKLTVHDIELYKNTPAWKMAKAVYEQDTTTIIQEADRDKDLVSFKDPKYGRTLLNWAVF
jgi:hypothetical protein